MGMDTWAETIYGTTEYSILDKLPAYMKELVEQEKHFNLPEFYKGLEIFWSDAGFHGIGKRINMNKKHTRTIESVKKIFKKYKLGKPKYCQFSALSV